jgi:PAS domain S-box-containing protein
MFKRPNMGKQVTLPFTRQDKLTDSQRFHLLVDAIRDYAIYMLDPDGFVTSWNAGGQKLKGYKPVEVIGQHFSRFFSPEDRAAGLPERILERAKSDGRYEAEGWRYRKDGSRFWANAIIQPIFDPDGGHVGYAKITRDITERRAAQEALVESERRFRMLVQSVIDYAIYMLDPSGIVTNWNAGAERLKGYAANEIVGQHFSRFYTKEDRAAGLPMRVLDTASNEGRFEGEGWRIRKDGSRFWASVVLDAIRDEGGKLVGFAKITRDITERRAAHEALLESERQLRLLVRGVTDYAFFMLDPNGIVSSWNMGAERIKGYTADEIIGQHFSRFYTEHERAASVPARVLHIAETEGRFETEGWRVRKDGSLFCAHVVIDPIRDENGRLVGYAKITRDITERRRAQQALQEAEQRRAHTQKMEALGQLTGGVAHDFNNLLMIVSGATRMVRKLIGEDSKSALALEALESVVKRGQTLTRQLLSFSRNQALKPEVVSLRERLEGARAFLATSIGPQFQIAMDVPALTWAIKVDPSEFELALVNLVLNSRDAMPDGGVIKIVAENAVMAAHDTPQRIEGEFVAITVSDSGTGIAPDILPKIFDPFFTTKGPGKGTGLGLSQVHGFAHQAGGTVTISSEFGHGTRVTIYLPRASEVAEIHGERPPLSAPGGRALIVEDNPDVAAATATLASDVGYTVHQVATADAALEAVDKEAFDLVVSDIVMAGAMDGLALARKLRSRWPGLPIVLVTGYSGAADQAGAEFPLLRKPYQLADLSHVVAQAIRDLRPPPANLVNLDDVRRGHR